MLKISYVPSSFLTVTERVACSMPSTTVMVLVSPGMVLLIWTSGAPAAMKIAAAPQMIGLVISVPPPSSAEFHSAWDVPGSRASSGVKTARSTAMTSAISEPLREVGAVTRRLSSAVANPGGSHRAGSAVTATFVAWRVLNRAGVNAKRGVFLVIAAVLWWWPPPEGLTLEAWRLFVIVASAIGAVVANALPLLTASVLAVAATVLGRVLTPEQAYAGFANGTILLIVLAFLVARSVITSGLGVRIGHFMVGRFGRSAIGLSYSIFFVDALIAPAFPSSTARSGVLYPMALSLANAAGATPDAADRRRLGTFLMFSGIASISLSSALWLTAMAGNPLGAELARQAGVEIAFRSWLKIGRAHV